MTAGAAGGQAAKNGAGRERILVIKLGALGDFILALGPMAAIRRHHPEAHVTLLTTPPYAELGRQTGLFDDVWVDTRPKLWSPETWRALRARLRDGRFTRVYDLQTSDRSGWYFRLLWPGPWPEWSGIVRGCSHPHDNPDRDRLHTVERQAEQLARAGINPVPLADLSFLSAELRRFKLPDRIVLFCPGGSPHRPRKRWPAEGYASLGRRLIARGVTPVLIGTTAEGPVLARIVDLCPQARSLVGSTSLAEIASLARVAEGAVGNDTGPMHLISLAGCPSVVLFSQDSEPSLCGPRGPAVRVLREDSLEALEAERVERALDEAQGRGRAEARKA